MTVLDLSLLDKKDISNCFYMESLSFDNLPKKGINLINESYNFIMKYNSKSYKKYFDKKLDIFSPNGGKNSSSDEIQKSVFFQAHDIQTIKIKSSNTDINSYIHLDLQGYSYSDYEEYKINILFEDLSNYKSELTEYSKGKILNKRDCEFNTVFNKYDFSFREIVFNENEKLQGEIVLVFVQVDNFRHADLGERKVLTLTFTPENINHSFVKIPRKINKHKL